MSDQAPIARVVAVTGEVYVRNENGEMRLLAADSVIYPGERIIADPGESVELAMANGQSMLVDSQTPLTFSNDMLPETADSAEDAALESGSIEALLRALESGEEIDDLLEAPAAGAGGNDGHSFVILERIVENLDRDQAANESIPAAVLPVLEGQSGDDELIAVQLDADTTINVVPTISSVTNDSQTEGSDLVHTVTLSNPSAVATSHAFSLAGDTAAASDFGAPTFSNGVTLSGGNITVPAGVSSFTVTIPTSNDTIDELDESLDLTVGGVAATGTIEDNDAAPTLTVTSTNNFTEDSGSAVGDVVATYTTFDADGDTVSVMLSDTTNYALDGAGNVTLTSAGLALINAGSDLPAFTLTPNDGTQNGTPGTIDPSVTAVNDAPVANDDTAIITDEDTTVSNINVLGNDTDEEGDSLTVIAASATNGTVTINADGTLNYTPNANYNGDDVISYTISDGNGGTDTATVAVSVGAVNDAATAITDNYITAEGSVFTVDSATGLLNNDSDPEGDSLTVSQVATNGSGTGAVVVDGVTQISTALGGLVTVNADGSFSYQAPASQNHSGSAYVQDSFVYRANDGIEDSGWTTVNINLADTAPVANNDLDSVGYGGTIIGNVISGVGGTGSGADELGADAAQLTEVTYAGQTYGADELVGGSWTINADSGTLVINQDGSYSYTSEQAAAGPVTVGGNSLGAWTSTVNLYGFNAGTAFESGANTLNLTAADGTVEYRNNQGLYINSPGNSDDNNELDSSEAIVIDLKQLSSSATVTLHDIDNNDGGSWVAYDAAGNQVDSGTFDSSGVNNKILDVTITPAGSFQYLVFTGTENNDEYNIRDLTYQPTANPNVPDEVFGYSLSDADGDTATANLTIEHDLNALAITDMAKVEESALATGTNAGSEQQVATGNLIDNDEGVGVNTSITEVIFGGVTGTSSGGVISINGSHGTLTVYTVDSVDHRAGDYEYTLTSASSGDSAVEPFQYRLSDSGTGKSSTAMLEISIEDDAPVGNPITQSLSADGELATYNLVLVLDISGSMNTAVSGGQTRLDIAIEALSELIRSTDDFGNVNVQIVPFSSSASSSVWFVDDIYSAINFLEALQADGGTYYDTALQQVINANAATTPPPADQTLLYFVSDGEPNNSHGVDNGSLTYRDQNGNNLTDVAAWEAFAGEKVDISFGIGIGGAQLTDLRQVAFPNTDADGNGLEDYAIRVSDPSDLTATLLQTVSDNTVTGSLGLLNTGGSSGFMIGADGGYISSVEIDGNTYSYDPNAAPANAQSVAVNTLLGGIFTLNFVTGAYTYEVPVSQSIIGQQENFQITVVDNDGDSLSTSILLDLNYNATVDANRDIVITNDTGGGPIEIPAIALLWNDNGQNRTLTSAFNADGGTVTGTNTVSFDPTEALALFSESDFETVAPATQMDESLLDSEVNPLNNNMATAEDLTDRSLFSSNDSNVTSDVNGYSLQYSGKLVSDAVSSNGQDEDWLEIKLAQGEALWADIDGAVNDITATTLNTDVFIYDEQGNQLAQISENSGGAFGSFVATYTGSYYVVVKSANPIENGVYELDLTIDASNGNYDQGLVGSFEYNMNSDSTDDSTTVQILGSSGTTITGSQEDEVLVGDSSNDTLLGGAGDDALVGKAGDDTLLGGDGSDLLIGGLGGDTLTGGAGADVFAWTLGDADNSRSDVVTDFDVSAVSNGGDVLDLRDLLVDEQNNDLTDYMYMELSETDSGTTLVHINTTGGFSNGYNPADVEQTIELSNVDLVSGFADQNAMLQDLVNNGKIIVD